MICQFGSLLLIYDVIGCLCSNLYLLYFFVIFQQKHYTIFYQNIDGIYDKYMQIFLTYNNYLNYQLPKMKYSQTLFPTQFNQLAYKKYKSNVHSIKTQYNSLNHTYSHQCAHIEDQKLAFINQVVLLFRNAKQIGKRRQCMNALRRQLTYAINLCDNSNHNNQSGTDQHISIVETINQIKETLNTTTEPLRTIKDEYYYKNTLNVKEQSYIERLGLNQQKQQSILNYLIGADCQSTFSETQCVKCVTHFIHNTAFNEFNSNSSYYPIHGLELANYNNYAHIQREVFIKMCAMLNQHNGGIILIGCSKINIQLLLSGCHFTQKYKDILQQKIQATLPKIYPPSRRNIQVFIDFVPVMKIQYKWQDGAVHHQVKTHVEGTYICRIHLKPNNSYAAYIGKSHMNMSDKIKITNLWANQNNETKAVDNSQQYNFMSKKFKQSYQCQTKNGSCHYNIKCRDPLRGQAVFEEKKMQERQQQYKQQTQYYQVKQFILQQQPVYNKKKVEQHKNGMIEGVKKIKQPHAYKLLTLVVGDKLAMNKILGCANEKEKRGIRIEKMFEEYNFKLVKTTWVMFHDDKFESLKKTVERHNITYKNKEVKMITTTLYLQIQNGVDPLHYNQLYQILVSQVGATIKSATTKQTNNGTNWILHFNSLMGSIFAYFFLGEINYRAKFIRGASYFKQEQTRQIQSQQYSQSPQYTNAY